MRRSLVTVPTPRWGSLVRAILAVATFAVVWLIVSPASAATPRAPVCDPRGAIGFAPPPQIQDVELSFDIPADCFEVTFDLRDAKNVVPGGGGPIAISFSQEPAVAITAAVPALGSSERLPVPAVTPPRLPPGVRRSLERPPRA
jgi:hypothetical protein